jgi:hypothetical protein
MEDIPNEPVELSEDELGEVAGGWNQCGCAPPPCGCGEAPCLNLAVAVAAAVAISI